MPALRPSYQWSETGLLRASTFPDALDDFAPPTDLDLTGPAVDTRAVTWLADLRRQPLVRAALAAASPDLLNAIDAIDPDRPDATDQRRLRRLVITTVCYMLRWRHRATPFGLFAGVAAIRRGPVTALRWGEGHRSVRQVDPVWLASIITRLHACPELLKRLQVVTNTAITVRGNRLVAPGCAPAPSDNTDTDLAPVEVSVRATRPVRTAVDTARAPIRVEELTEHLSSAFPEATSDQIEHVIAGLIEQNILISNLHPPMTSPDALGHVCGILRDVAARDIPGVARLSEFLDRLHCDLADARSFTNLGAVTATGGSVAVFGAAPEAGSGSGDEQVPLMADTILDAALDLPEQVGIEAAKAAAVLCRLSPYPFGTPPWRDYHGQFLARYGTGLPVPVLELIGDGGLGFPAGYLGSGLKRAPRLFTARDERLLTLVQETMAGGGELVLTEALVDELADDRDAVLSWPDRVEIGVQVCADSAEEVNRGHFTLLVTGTPRPGSSMAGRHAHHLPDQARVALAATFATTEPDSIAVQLSFPPRRRRNAPLTAAIPMAGHLLPLGEHPGNDGSGTQVVRMDELAVVADPDRFHLLHQPSGRRVQIRVPHALEATVRIPPLARFLSEIITARDAVYTGFHFGAASQMPYLPRVRYRRTVLAAARWLLHANDLPGHSAPHQEWEKAFAAWRERWGVPDRVAITDHDRRLALDLNQALHRQLLRARLSRASRLELREDLAEHGWIGRAHELLLVLRLTPTPATTARTAPIVLAARNGKATARTPHSALPGDSAVLFARLVAHPDQWDELLTRHLQHLVQGLGNRLGEIPRWWFLRHQDLRHPATTPYLGLYFHLGSRDHYGQAAAQLAAWTSDLVRQNLAAKLTLDTFHPQPGQYGHGSALTAAFAVFAADASAALAQIKLAERAQIPAAALTAASMVDLAGAFAPTPDDGARHLLDALPRQHGKLDPVLRDHALRLIDLAQTRPGLAELPGGSEMISAWHQRANALRAYRTQLQAERYPTTVLPVLLRGHHRRVQTVDTEPTTLRLARACAIRRTHRAAR